MKQVWSPELASAAYMGTVKSCENLRKPGAAEFVAALAAGWNARLIVEIWTEGKAIATSIGLNIARYHTGGRHVCIVPDNHSRSLYFQAMRDTAEKYAMPEIVVGEPATLIQQFKGIDFFMVDIRDNSFATVVRELEHNHGGVVLVCENVWSKPRNYISCGSDFGGTGFCKLVCSFFLPVGDGFEIVRLPTVRGKLGSDRKWITHVDIKSGVEHVIRR